MHLDTVVTMEALYELHKEWEELVAHREAIRAAPYDPCTEADLVSRLVRHHEKLLSMREAILRQSLNDCDANPADAGAPAHTN